MPSVRARAHLGARRRVSLLAVAGATLVAVAPADAARTPRTAPPPFSGVFEFSDVTPGTQLTECPQAGLDGDRPLDRRRRDEVGADQRTLERHPLQPGLRLLPAERDQRRDQPAHDAQRRRRRERLPPRLLAVRVLRLDRRRQELLRRPDPGAVAAGHRQLRQRGRPGGRVRPRGRRVLRRDRVQPHRRPRRDLRDALDERRLHVDPGMRADRRHARRPGRRPVPLQLGRRRPAPARRRRRDVQRGRRRAGQRLDPVRRQGVHRRWAAARRRAGAVLHAAHPPGRRLQPRRRRLGPGLRHVDPVHARPAVPV